jgi:hypothetical protein
MGDQRRNNLGIDNPIDTIKDQMRRGVFWSRVAATGVVVVLMWTVIFSNKTLSGWHLFFFRVITSICALLVIYTI